jgi:hypothetical protein
MFPNLFRGLFLVAALALLALVALVLLMSQDRRGRQKLLGSDAEPAQNFGNDHPYGALVVHVAAMLGAAYLAWKAIVSKRLFHDSEAADPAQFWFQWALLPLFEVIAGRRLILRIRALFLHPDDSGEKTQFP